MAGHQFFAQRMIVWPLRSFCAILLIRVGSSIRSRQGSMPGFVSIWGLSGKDADARMRDMLEEPEKAALSYPRQFPLVQSVLATWAGRRPAESLRYLSDGAILQTPGMFLWRIAVRADRGERHEQVLNACQVFVRFLVDNWLNNIMHPRWELFVPEYFFKSEPGTCVAWKSHVAGSCKDQSARRG